MNDEKNVHTEEKRTVEGLASARSRCGSDTHPGVSFNTASPLRYAGPYEVKGGGEADICVSCGAPVPEGRQVCPKCEEGGPSGTPVPTDEIRREIDIFDLIPAEAVVDANRLGFGFLAERGYDALGAWEDEAKCAALERELAERGEELRYSGAYDRDEETGKIVAILIWYSLYDREGRCVARSKGLKLVPKETEADAAGGSDGAKDT